MTREIITGHTLPDLEARFEELGERKFRAKQLLEWVFAKRASSFDEMTNLGVELREKLAAEFDLRSMTLAKTQGSGDATQKFLLQTPRRPLHRVGPRSGETRRCMERARTAGLSVFPAKLAVRLTASSVRAGWTDLRET